MIKAYDGQRVGAKAARVSRVRPAGNTPALSGGRTTEEIHLQQEHGARTPASLALPSATSAPLTGTLRLCARQPCENALEPAVRVLAADHLRRH